jgi:outer membrane protein insertion porin family
LTRLRTLLLVLAALVLALPSVAQAPGRVAAIEVQGNQRIEADTIRSYMLVQPGEPADPDRLDRSLRALFATGLFRDVEIRPEGNRVIVRVTENPLVNRVGFEGNRRVTSDVLRNETQLRARSVFTPAAAQADRARILEIYARRGRFGATVEPKIIELDQNRVDVVFEITEGNVALVSRIGFVGNESYSDSRLKEIIATREQAWYRLLSTSDNYDPDRLAFDRELLRRFYLRQGYADVEITGATAELAPDRSGFFLTYTISEGPRYRIGSIEVTSSLRGLDPAGLQREIPVSVGDWYDGDAVERADTQLTELLASRGFPFANVEPRVVRNREARTVDLTFEISEGPRAFVERIEITGNTRTQDRVIRREFRLAEGDPLVVQQVRRSRERLRGLGYFSDVQINSAPGSAPDRVILNTQVQERATGEFTIGGGFSTDAGLLADVGLRERNLLGTGIDARINVTLAQRRSQVDIGVTDPQFLDRNLAAGADVFLVQRNLRDTSGYEERRAGFALRMGYEINERLRQTWSYSLVDRELTDVAPDTSRFIQEQEGRTLLSQVSTTVTYDRRDSRIEPRSGYVVRVGADWAGLGGDVSYVRFRGDAQYYIPFERLLGNPDYVLVLAAGAGYLAPYGDNDTRIVDRFFLGGENLRGFQLGGAGPRDVSTNDALGGQTLWTSSAEFRFPLPLPSELGFIGRAFVDVGANFGLPGSVNDTGCPTTFPNCVRDDSSPRVGMGVGLSWRSPIGLINIDLAQAVVKKSYDETQVFRLGFGTRF